MDTRGKVTLAAGVGFILGAVAGGAGMYFFTKQYFQEKAEAEIQEMGEYYISKYGGGDTVDKYYSEESNDEVEAEEAKAQADYEAISDIYKSKDNEPEKVNTSYGKYYDGEQSDNSDAAPKKKKTTRKKKVDIEVVDQEVWDENPGNFDSRFLVYYDADSVLLDEESDKPFEENNEITKIVDIHSDDAVDGVLILQDNSNNCLYHVTVEQMAYSERILEDD